MALEKPARRESEEHSIKARKHELFEEKTRIAPAAPRKPAQVYLRETPAMPISQGVKVALWAVGALVLLLFVIVLVTRMGRPSRPAPPHPAGAATAPADRPPATVRVAARAR